MMYCNVVLKKLKKSNLILFYEMTINNGTKKIEAPSKGIPCTYYVESSVSRIFLRIGFVSYARAIKCSYDVNYYLRDYYLPHCC